MSNIHEIEFFDQNYIHIKIGLVKKEPSVTHDPAYYTSWPHLIHLHHKRKQDCLLQGQAQLNQKVVFRFVTLRLRGGGVSFDKNENHGLEMHVNSFEFVVT